MKKKKQKTKSKEKATEIEKLISESLRILLLESWRKYELVRFKDYPNITSVELNEIEEQIKK